MKVTLNATNKRLNRNMNNVINSLLVIPMISIFSMASIVSVHVESREPRQLTGVTASRVHDHLFTSDQSGRHGMKGPCCIAVQLVNYAKFHFLQGVLVVCGGRRVREQL